MTTTEPATTQQSSRILQTMAAADPDFTTFQAQFNETVTATGPLNPEIIEESLTALEQDPQQGKAIQALRNNPDAGRSFVTGEIATLVAITFLLRTHIKLERTSTGKWRFLIEHKAADTKLLTSLLNKLQQLLSG